mmetsp:Transcript_32865/g.37396  ORF Transcript_32865/g.37396 Transcript_32865/m.37396 type:complete len:180 (+) Transcript_32865:176-715(+)
MQLFAFLILSSVSLSVNGFVFLDGPRRVSITNLSAHRRDILTGLGSIATSAILLSSQPVEASYSAFTAREKDWEQRQKNGEVSYSSARSLRSQLSELVPENDDSRSKVFCPNGPSSAVSPLMENKCSDTLMAIPSVYGRTEDVVGNSIPGRAKPNTAIQMGGASASLASTPSIGGFPKY